MFDEKEYEYEMEMNDLRDEYDKLTRKEKQSYLNRINLKYLNFKVSGYISIYLFCEEDIYGKTKYVINKN